MEASTAAIEAITPVPISQYADEFLLLLDLYKKHIKSSEEERYYVLEVGTHHGGSLYHWIANAPKGAVILSIDNQHINDHLYSSWAQEYEVHVDKLHGDSRSQPILEAARNYSPFDWIFIDGDHSYEGVRADWENYKTMIAEGGVIAFHDITQHPFREVDLLWKEIKKGYRTMEIVSAAVREPHRAGIGVVFC